MNYWRLASLFAVFLLGTSGLVFAQDSAPVFTGDETEFEVTTNTYESFSVEFSDDHNNMTISFDVTSGHSITLDTEQLQGVNSGERVRNRFAVPDGSFGSVIVIEVTANDGTNETTQDLNFDVTERNRAPEFRIIVDGDSGQGSLENPFETSVGIGLGLEIDDPDSGLNRYGYAWDAVKMNGTFCPGQTMLMWNADVEPGLLRIGRMITSGRFRIIQDLVDGTHVIHEEVVVEVLPAEGGCNPTQGLEDVSFGTNLPNNVAARGQTYQLIADASSDTTVQFMMYASSTSSKPVSPLYTESRSACSNGCRVQWSYGAPPYDTIQYFWLDVESGGVSAEEELAVTVSGDGGGTSPPPPTGCSGDSWSDCSSSCGALSEFKVDAGCPAETILGGTTLELDGRLDTNQPIPSGEPSWVITNSAGFSTNELWLEDPTDWDPVLNTPEVDVETTVTLRFNVDSTGCSCFDDIDIVLIPDTPVGQDSADLSVEVDPTVVAGIGEQFDYRIVVANNGPSAATGIVLNHSVPAGISYLSSDPGICFPQGADSLTCGIADLPPSQTSAVDLTFTADAAGSVSPTVNVFASQFDPVGSNNSRVFNVLVDAVADLALSVSETEVNASIGQDVLVEYEVENLGPGTADNVQVTISLPDGASVVSSDLACQGGGPFVCDLGSLELGETAAHEFTVKLALEGEFNSSIQVTAAQFDPDEDDNGETVTFVVTEVAKLVFPHSLNVESPFPPNRYIGIAVFNPNSVATDVEFIAFDEAGAEVGRKLLSELEGRGPIPPQGQSAMLTGEILAGSEIASIIAQGTNGPVQLFFMLGDYNLTSLDGVAGPLVQGQRLHFPIARSNATEATVLFLFNGDPDNAVDVTLELSDSNGVLIAEAARTLIAQGSVAEEVATLFGLEEVDGSVRVLGNGVVSGFEVYSHGKGISALSAQVASKVTRLVAPHYFATDGGNTAVWLQNVGQNWANVSIKAYTDDGTLVGTHAFRLLKGERFIQSVTEFLPIEINGSAVASGYFVVDLEGGPVGIFPTDATVIGAITFTAFDGNTIATLPLSQVGGKQSRFLHVAQSDILSMYTGMAILNLSGNLANISVTVYDQNGVVVGQKTLDALGQGTRIVDILSGATFFQSDFEQVGGHIEISSDQEIFIFALFGDYGGNFLSAIEGRSQ